MSTFLYARLSALREAAPSFKSEQEKPPGLNSMIDAVAALVPAEVLTLHGVVVSATTKIVTPTNDAQKASNGIGPLTQVTAPEVLGVAFVGMLVLTVIFYWLGRRSLDARWVLRDWGRMCVPPLAFVAWTMLQRTTAFDGFIASLRFDVSEASRMVFGAFLAVIVAAVAGALAVQANKSDSVG